MIIQRLAEHYDRIAADPDAAESLPKKGYSVQKVSFCVVLEPGGHFQQFESLVEPGLKKVMPRSLLVPGQSKPPGSGINPCFLWDNAAYMLGFKLEDKNPERTAETFEAFRQRHLAIEQQVNCSAFTAVCAFLRNWSAEAVAAHTSDLKDIISHFGVFRIAGERQFVHEVPDVVAYWSGHGQSNDSAPSGTCLVTGHDGPIARLHEPKIKGVYGSQSAGALLVSFNDEAYKSFGKDQSYNAPVGVETTFKYTNALNHLLSRSDRRMQLGDATVVFWAEHYTSDAAFVSEILADLPPPPDSAPAEDRQRAAQVRLFLSQLREGHATSDAIDPQDETRFYVLGLSPNASRIAVRFWIDTTIGDMKERLSRHLRDLELVGAREQDSPLVMRRLVAATGRAEVDPQGKFRGYDTDSVSPLLAGAIARAILTGGAYPASLLVSILNRLRADGAIRHERIAAIKACIIRNSRIQGHPKEVSVALNTERADPAYLTGRLFALLEKIQTDSAVGNLNSTIKDRYFSAASATPGIVFPRLIRLSQHHLAKMETGRKVYYERQLGEVTGKLDGFARNFNLEDQGLFAIGYFHQRQDLFTSKKNGKEGDSK